jgi:hypothetical protein
MEKRGKLLSRLKNLPKDFRHLELKTSDGHIISDVEEIIFNVKWQVIFQKAQGRSLEAIKEYVLDYNDFGENDFSTEIERLVTAFFYLE